MAKAETAVESLSTGSSPAIEEHFTFHLESFVLDERTLVSSSVLSYLALVVTLIERRPVGREELLQMLRRSLRQRSIGRLPHREYVLRYLNEHPPPRPW